MTARPWFAAVDAYDPLTGAVYGLGATEEEALADARRLSPRDAEAGFSVVPCTVAAARHVLVHGGAPSPRLAVSRREGVRVR